MSTAFAPRNPNLMAATPEKKAAAALAVSPQPMEIDSSPAFPKAKEVLYSDDTAAVADLISIFQGLALDTSLSEGEKQKQVAELMNMGPETDRALRKVRVEKQKQQAVETAPAPQEVESLKEVAAVLKNDAVAAKSWWQLFKETFTWKAPAGTADDGSEDGDEFAEADE